MRYYTIRPQVPGGFGPGTIFEENGGRRRLRHAQIIVDSWPDHLFKNVMVYAVSEQLMRRLLEADIVGAEFTDCEVLKGEQFAIANPNPDAPLPKYHQMIPTGIPRVDDIAKEGNALVVSDRVKAILDEFVLTDVIWENA